MRRHKYLLWVTLCLGAAVLSLMLSAAAFGQSIYYVRPGGNDNLDGLSDENAWESVTKVNQVNPVSGSTIKFERDGIWTDATLTLAGLTDGRYLTLTYYGTGAIPVFDGSGLIADGSWVFYAANLYYYTTGTEPNRLFDDGVELQPAAAGDDQNDLNATKRWTYTGGRIYVYSTSAPTNIRRGTARSNVVNISKDHITFRGLEFRGGDIEVELNGAHYFVIDSCKAGTYGAKIIRITNCVNFEIKNSDIIRNDAIQCIEYAERKVGSYDNIRLLQGCVSGRIHHCKIWDYGHDGVNMGYGIDDEVIGADIVDNWVYNCDFRNAGDYGRWAETHGAWTKVRNNRFFNNYVHHSYESAQVQGIGNIFSYNIIDTVLEDLSNVADVRRCGGMTFCHFELEYNDSNVVEHNTFLNCDGMPIEVQYNAGFAIVQNNLSVNGGSKWVGKGASFELWFQVEGNSGTLPTETRIVRNNLAYFASYDTLWGIGYSNWESSDPHGRFPLASFEDLDNGTTRIFSGNIHANPILQANYTPGSGSPAIDAGLNLGYTSDFYGNSIVGTPDIGAVEFTSSYAHHLHWLVHPNNVFVGYPIIPPMQIAVHDINHNVMTGDTRIVSIALKNAGSATMGGDDENYCVSGVATFDLITVSAPVSGCYIEASATGLTPVNSNTFSVVLPDQPYPLQYRVLLRK